MAGINILLTLTFLFLPQASRSFFLMSSVSLPHSPSTFSAFSLTTSVSSHLYPVLYLFPSFSRFFFLHFQLFPSCSSLVPRSISTPSSTFFLSNSNLIFPQSLPKLIVSSILFEFSPFPPPSLSSISYLPFSPLML